MRTMESLQSLDFQRPDAREKFQQLTETASRQITTGENFSSSTRKKTDTMVLLWERLGQTFGASFLNQFGAVGGDAFETWSLGLQDVTPEQIEAGFISVLRSGDKYPPNLKTFRSACFDISRYGLPDADQAYDEAARHCHDYKHHNWSHEAVYKALLDVGVSVLREMPERDTKPLFATRYQVICEMVIAGKPLNVELPKMIASRVPNFLTEAENQKRMDKMRAELNL